MTDAFYTTVTAQSGGCDDTCIYQDKEKHYHCNWVSRRVLAKPPQLTEPIHQDNCREVILPTDKPFRRLEHYKMHEYSRKLSLTKDPLTMTHLATSIDGMFCRKRGRPPKNRVIEVWNDYVSGSLRRGSFGNPGFSVADGQSESHGFPPGDIHEFQTAETQHRAV